MLKLPRSAFGTALAHFGLGVTVLGIIVVSMAATEHVLEMKVGETTEAGGYTIRFDRESERQGPNFTEDAVHFTILQDGVEKAETDSAKRIYTARQMPTTEAGIVSFGLSQVYISVGDKTEDGKHVIRIWYKPWILCIWGGALIMMAGGAVSLSDRRLRVGAPSRRARPSALPEPAE